MYWIVDTIVFDDARSCADYIMENCDDSVYDDGLDECYGEVEVCGYKYCASYALRELDPIAYRCGRSDWEDSEAEDLVYYLERMNDGETDKWYGSEVECVDNEEEEEDEDEEDEE